MVFIALKLLSATIVVKTFVVLAGACFSQNLSLQ